MLDATTTQRGEVSPSTPRLLRKHEVLQIVGLGRTQLDEAVKKGAFPAPIRVIEGGRRVAWLAHEIEAHLKLRIAARNELPAA
jgi:prophage regulatory protein